jgi:murein DD-endopeptidase MepM/ murein hydrolase activator NlpD
LDDVRERKKGRGNRPVLKGRALAAILTIAVLGLPATPASASEASSNLQQTRTQIRATRARLHSAMQTDAQIRAALNLITAKLYAAQNDLATARNRMRRIDVQIGSAERKVVQLGSAARDRQNVIDDRAAALYIMGPVGGMDAAITGASSIGDYLERAGALDFIGTFDRTVLQDLAALRHNQVIARRELKLERASALVVAREVADHVSLVAEAAAAQQEAHQVAAARVAGYEQELKDLAAQEATILSIIRSRSGGYHGTISGGQGKLGFAWPTVNHHINSPYGPRGGGFHTGMDVECSTGDPIAASKEGKVIAAEWGGGYGNMIIIDHGGGYSSLYAHQSRLYAHQGQIVSQHQVIGACGATGNATGSHLHFEIRINGNHTNPRPYMP